MIPTFNRTYLILLYSISTLLIGCAQQSQIDDTRQNYLPTTDQQTLADADIILQAAKEKKKINDRTRLFLQSSFLFINHEQYDKAEKILRNINQSTIDDNNLSAFYLSQQAEILLHQQKTQDALLSLQKINNSDLLSTEIKTISLQTKAKAYFKNADYFKSIEARNSLSTLALSKKEQKINNDLLWKTLNLIPIDEVKEKHLTVTDLNLAGWLELNLIDKEYQHDLEYQQKELTRWLTFNPEHNANKQLPETLEQIKLALKNRPKRIAILLPSEGPLAKTAASIKQGFLNSYYLSLETGSVTPELLFFNTSDMSLEQEYREHQTNSINKSSSKINLDPTKIEIEIATRDSSKKRKEKGFLSLYNKAILAEADLVIGPIKKNYINALKNSDIKKIPTLSLNYTIHNNHQNIYVKPNTKVFEFGLSPEDEIIFLSEQARLRSYKNVAILAPSSSLGERLSNSFSADWLSNNGNIVDIAYYTDTKSLTKVIEKMLGIDQSEKRFRRLYNYSGKKVLFHSRRRQDIDFVFLVSNPEMGRQIVPTFSFHKASDIPVISSSHIYEGEYDAKDKDLSRVIFPIIPAILNNNEHNKKAWQKQYLRYRPLVAMGTDAYNLSNKLPILKSSNTYKVYGETGILTVNQNLRINRQPSLASFHGARVKPEATIFSSNNE